VSEDRQDRWWTTCRERLAATLAVEGPIDVPLAALWIAAEDDPGLDPDAARARLAEFARAAAGGAHGIANPFARYEAVRVHLFEEVGLRGNIDDYENPDNSNLDRVLDTGLGIPITLSIVTVEALREAGFEACGVGLPGHFVVRLTRDGRTVWCDPFHGGTIVTEEDCRTLVARATGRASLFRPAALDGTPPRAILSRLLRNLKRIWLAREDYGRALAVVDRLRIVHPEDARELRDRGILQAHLGDPRAAIEDLEAYLATEPLATDAGSVRGRLAWLRRRIAEPS
jgi:regulator of sirC expression with transglutaminase-like and TPR domain